MPYVNPLFQRTRQAYEQNNPVWVTPTGARTGPTEEFIQPGAQTSWPTDTEAQQAMLEAQRFNNVRSLVGSALTSPGFQVSQPGYEPMGALHGGFQQPGIQNVAIAPGQFQQMPVQQLPTPTGSVPFHGGSQFGTFGPSTMYQAEPGERPIMVRQPPCDVFDQGETIVLEFELPGVTKKDIELVAQDRGITLRAITPETHDEENLVQSERGRIEFRRQVPLGLTIVPDKLEAKFSDGILTVTAPKKEPTSGPKRIEIKYGPRPRPFGPGANMRVVGGPAAPGPSNHPIPPSRRRRDGGTDARQLKRLTTKLK